MMANAVNAVFSGINNKFHFIVSNYSENCILCCAVEKTRSPSSVEIFQKEEIVDILAEILNLYFGHLPNRYT